MAALAPAGHLQVVDLLKQERGELLQLLGDLSAEQWGAPTECPAWTVRGIALHLLGDDVSLLSRQRDGAAPGVVFEASGGGWHELLGALDRFNERWVEAASFFSPDLVVELLRVTGEWTHKWYTSVDPNLPGETIHWISLTGPQPYWLVAAREYLERWVHQLQIRRAVNSPGLMNAHYVVPAVAVTLRGFPRGWAKLPAPPDTTVALVIADADTSWTLQRGSDRWVLHDGSPPEPTVRLVLDLDGAAGLFSRRLLRSEVQELLKVEGEADLGSMIVSGLAAFFGREE